MKKPTSPLLFGGAFDPFHLGHLGMLEHAYTNDPTPRQVVLIPSGISITKGHAFFSTKNRLEMLQLLCQNEFKTLMPKWIFQISELELNAQTTGYTIDTLAKLSTTLPPPYSWLLGADQFFKFHSWKMPEKILEITKLMVISRNEAYAKNHYMRYWKTHSFPEPLEKYVTILPSLLLPYSSSEIREKIQKKQSVKSMLSKSIVKYLFQIIEKR